MERAGSLNQQGSDMTKWKIRFKWGKEMFQLLRVTKEPNLTYRNIGEKTRHGIDNALRPANENIWNAILPLCNTIKNNYSKKKGRLLFKKTPNFYT